MEKSRKQKLLIIIALVFGIASLSIGFAAFSTTLNISSSASVSPSSDTFSVKFSTEKDSLVVDEVEIFDGSGATASNGIIDNSTNPTLKNIFVEFTQPEQHVEYIIYARNEGEYTAYLNSVNFLGEKICESDEMSSNVQEACDSIELTVSVGGNTYFETTEISGHSLEKKTGEEIRIAIEYLSTDKLSDAPFKVTFPDISLIYSTIDDPSFVPEKVVKLVSGTLNDPGSIVSIGDEQFYVFGQEGGNVKLLSMYNLYVGNIVDDSWNVIPLTNPTGVQDSSAKGYSNLPFIGTIAFSNIGTSYSGSIVEGYVNNYASYLTSLGANISSARLITKEELEGLGCSSYDYSCSTAPSWVYATSYWTDTASDNNFVWFVSTNSSFVYDYYFDDGGVLGVRPVIEVSLSEFE